MFLSPSWGYASSPSRNYMTRFGGEERNFERENFRPFYFADIRPQQRFRRDTFLDPEDYYDPLFSSDDGSRQQKQCNCKDCQMERYFKQRQNLKSTHNRNQRQNLTEKDVSVDATSSDENDASNLSQLDDECNNYQTQNNQNKNIEVEQKDLDDINNRDESVLSESDQELDENQTDSDAESTEFEEEREVLQREDTDKVTTDEAEIENDETVKNIERKIELIDIIKSEVEELYRKVDSISTVDVKNYDYLFCEEMLVKCLLKLDGILTEGEEKIRTARKNVVNEINKALSHLEMKANKKTEEQEV